MNWYWLSRFADNIRIEKILPQDLPAVEEILRKAFPQYASWVCDYVRSLADWGLSGKAVVKGQTVGVYIIGTRQITDVVNPQAEGQEDLSHYQNKQGVEGVALAVLPEFQGQGVGRKLKNAAERLSADYIWGEQLQGLNNLDHWLKRRRLVRQNPAMNITLQDLPKALEPATIGKPTPSAEV